MSSLESLESQRVVSTKEDVLHQLIPATPSPPGHRGAFACLFSPGGGAFANFALPRGRAFAILGAIPELLTRTRFPIRI